MTTVLATGKPAGSYWHSDLSYDANPSDAIFLYGVTIPEDSYDFTRFRLGVETSDKRPLSAEVDFSTGDFFDGHRDEIETTLEWRASRHALFDLEYEWNDVDVPDGDFTVNNSHLHNLSHKRSK